MTRLRFWHQATRIVCGLLVYAGFGASLAQANPPQPVAGKDPYEALVPNEALLIPFQDQVPIRFVSRTEKAAQWDQLQDFWNESTETVINPANGQKVTRRMVLIKVPLGLSRGPAIPAENPLTVAKWNLGKKLYYDKILSSNNTISCATCHDQQGVRRPTQDQPGD